MYVADNGATNRIRQVTSAGVVKTVVPSLVANAVGVVSDGHGSLYATVGNEIDRISLGDLTVSTIAGSQSAGFANGPGSAAQFFQPSGLALDSRGNIYVADTHNSAIRKISPDMTVSTLFGRPSLEAVVAGSLPDASLNRPYGLAFTSDGQLIITDEADSVIVGVAGLTR